MESIGAQLEGNGSDEKQFMTRLLFWVLAIPASLGCLDTPGNNSLNNQSAKRQKPVILWTTAWNSNGENYAIGGDDRLLRMFNAQDNSLSNTYALPGAVQSLDWNSDGKLLAVGIDGQAVQIYNVETKSFITLKEVTGSRALDWNRDGKLLAVADYEGVLHIYDKQGRLVSSIKKENTKTDLSVHWHPTKNVILTGGDRIRLYDSSGKLLSNIKHRKEETIILTVRWHPSGAYFATGDYGHKEENIESLLQYWKEDGKLFKSLTGSKAEYRNIRWNNDGTALATASDGLRLWSKDGQILYTGVTEDLLWGIDWDNRNKSIITSSADGHAIIWNAQTKAIKKVL